MEKFRHKYRIESNRLKGWNYSSNGLYFITIVTCGRELYFGEIISNEMHLNDFGIIALNEWYKSTDIRQEIFVDEFILMPNHLHAIVAICNGECALSPTCDATFQSDKPNHPFQRQPKSISSFVAGYKSALINQIDDFIDINKLPMKKFNKQNPLWQANYHDHIIRNDASYLRIKNYIINNPMNWNDDTINAINANNTDNTNKMYGL
ncbi:MAG: transposase [Paludibacter sp.]|nr:transposase [Paludibacter sp.]